MPRRSVPRYWHHKPTGQARVRIDGQDHYLGEFGSDESHERYAKLIAEWQGRQKKAPRDLAVRQLAMLYIEHCKVYYRKNGKQTTEVQAVRDALKRLNEMHRDQLATGFSPRMRELDAEVKTGEAWEAIAELGFDEPRVEKLNAVIRGTARYFATSFATCVYQFRELDGRLRMRLRCMRLKRKTRTANNCCCSSPIRTCGNWPEFSAPAG